VTPRAHPHGVRVKGGRYRRLFISDALDRLYGEHLWQLCDAGADLAVADLDAAHVFTNLAGGTRFTPWRPESVYDLVGRLRRDLAGTVPQAWTPHWMRHGHATALLLAGTPVHVVSRRLGHADVQTTLNLYAHVTDDADMRAVAEWKAYTAGWRIAAAGAGEGS
jgi:integrase